MDPPSASYLEHCILPYSPHPPVRTSLMGVAPGLTHWMYFMLWPSINYVVFPTVQTLTSDKLRRHTFGCIYSRKASPLQQVEMMEETRPNNNVPLF